MFRTKNRYYFLLLIVALTHAGCLGTKHLKENEKMLYSQRIDAPGEISTSALKDLYMQESNRKFLRLPIHSLVGIYYFGLARFKPAKIEKKMNRYETKINRKIEDAKSDKKEATLGFRKLNKMESFRDKLENGNLFMKWGEPLAVYDSEKVQLTAERFTDYLFSTGYFLNKVTTETMERTSKTIRVIYTVTPGIPYTIDTIFYHIPDSSVHRLVLNAERSSFIKQGERYQQENFSKERERIDLNLKEQGYFDFSRQYIEFDIDTSYREGHRVGVRIAISEPARRETHKKFYIDEVHFTTDAGISLPGVSRRRETYRGTDFEYYERAYSAKVLSQRIFIRPGDPYSRNRTFNTQRQLANLDAFKFVNVNYDTTGGKFVAHIFTSALDRYQWSNEVGLSVTQGFPGPFYNINFKKRNLFKGLENFEINGRIGYEGVASATETSNVYQSVEAGINASITFPQFLFPFKEETRYRLGRINPRTRALVGFNYTDRPEYKRSATTFNYIYSWDNQRVRRFDFTLTNLSIINSNTDPAFQNLLDSLEDQGNNLYLTFDPSFVSSMIFSMTWNHGNYGNLEKSSVFVRWSLESGGTLQNFIQYPIIEKKGLQSFQYLRLAAEARRLFIINKNNAFATRINGGIGYSYATKPILPYEKYFFSGGSNSVRAWRPRRLGPGSFRPPESSNPANDGLYDYRYERPGEIMLELNAELRKKLFGFVEGAIFLDAGNVWTFEELKRFDSEGNQVENGNSEFKFSEFYREMGIGTGFGFRFNFSFLILRFDVGIKVYDPARLEGDRFVLNNVKFFKPFGVDKEPVIYNVGVGFPF